MEPSRPSSESVVLKPSWGQSATERHSEVSQKEGNYRSNFLIDGCLGNSFSTVVTVVQSLNHVWLFTTPWTAAYQAALSFTISQNFLKVTSIESVMPSNHLIFCCPLLLPSIFPSIRGFSNELALRFRWPKYWNFIFSIKFLHWIFRVNFL